MEMVLMQHTMGGDPMKFLATTPINHHVHGNSFVRHPEGFYCETCDEKHGYPSRELTDPQSNDFLMRLSQCTHRDCAILHFTRRDIFVNNDYLHKYFTCLDKKFDTFQDLTTRYPNLDWTGWKLVREYETARDPMTEGPVMAMLKDLPEGILEECRSIFREFLQKVYREKTGFVKGKFLVLSTEILFRQCSGNIDLFLQTLNQAYALVESRYCSISRLAMEAGFWQVCPELGGFFWRDTVFRTQFPFLKKFLDGKRFVSLKNFSLSMGPYYLIGGGYFSYFRNRLRKNVVWFVPNFWSEAFTSTYNSDYWNAGTFWYGWDENGYGYGPEGGPQYGYPYTGLTPMELANNIREGYGRAANYYYF